MSAESRPSQPSGGDRSRQPDQLIHEILEFVAERYRLGAEVTADALETHFPELRRDAGRQQPAVPPAGRQAGDGHGEAGGDGDGDGEPVAWGAPTERWDQRYRHSTPAGVESKALERHAGRDDSAQQDQGPDVSGAPDTIAPGTQVGQYTLVQLLGRGGMGDVYLARHQRFNDRRFALKVLRAAIQDQAAERQRFEHEIRTLGDLVHPHVVMATDAGEFSGRHYLVMEFVDGQDLAERVARHGPFAPDDAMKLIRQAGKALRYAHARGLVHRDVKPSNLMLARDGTLKLLDLGLARLRCRDQRLTEHGQLLGTPDYMPPEQWSENGLVGPESDIYALGCTWYHLLAGEPPFAARPTPVAKLTAHLLDQPPPLTERRSQMPAEARELLAQCLDKQPAARPTAEQLVRRLDVLLGCDAEPAATVRHDGQDDPRHVLEPTVADHAPPRPDDDLSARASGAGGRRPVHESPNARRRAAVLVAASLLGICLLGVGLLAIGHNGGWWAERAGVGQRTDSTPPTATGQLLATGQSPATATHPPAHDSPGSDLAAAPLALLQFSVTRFQRPEGSGLLELGVVGRDTFRADFGDYVRLQVDFNRPAYCYVIALNPADNIEDQLQLCYPEDAPAGTPGDQVVPQPVQRLECPSDPASFFPLVDGRGEQAYLLVYSDQPLPSFARWREQCPLSWPRHPGDGVWRLHDGRVVPVARPGGRERSGPTQLQRPQLERILQQLREVDGAAEKALQLIAFPVL